MDDELVKKIISIYDTFTSTKPWHNEALESLTDVLTSMNTIDNDNIDYVKLRSFIVAKNTENIFQKLKYNLARKNIKTNSDLKKFVEGHDTVFSNGVRDIFGFRSTGPRGLIALYTYMKREMDYCPFKEGYTSRELNV